MAKQVMNLTAWVGAQMAKMVDEAANDTSFNEAYRVTSFMVAHSRSNGLDEVQTINLGSKQRTPKEIADTLDQIAGTHACGLSGRQQYVIKCIFASDEVTPTTYNLGKAGESNDLGLGTEGPTPTGLIAQLMRLNEAHTRIGAVHTEAIISKQGEIIENLMTQVSSQMTENAKAFTVLKEMIIDKAIADHANQKELLLEERKTQERQKLMSLVPGLVNKALGTKIFPEGSIAEIVIKQLKNTLRPEQIEGLAQILDPEQLSMILPLLDSGPKPEKSE